MGKYDVLNAKASPRITDENVLHWYAGDVFSIQWIVTFLDDGGAVQEIAPTDHILFEFYDSSNKDKPVVKFDFTDIYDNCVLLEFTPTISKKMSAGKYTYCVKWGQYDEEGNLTRLLTIGAKGEVVVDECH